MIAEPLLFVISIEISVPELVKLLRATDEPQAEAVGDGGKVLVGAGAGVFVALGLEVFVAVGGLGVRVMVGESVGFGSTRSVLVGSNVIVGILVLVCVGTSVGVDVISLCISPWASSSETGVTSASEQYCPVNVQAVLNSS